MKKNKKMDDDGAIRLIRKGFLIMRLFLIFMVLGILQSTASVYSQNKRFSLNEENISIREVIELIEEQSEYRFFYEEAKLNVNEKLNLDVENSTIKEVLDELFKQKSVVYKIMENNFIVLKSSKSIINSTQQKNVTGNVSDSSGQPLPGVSIVIKNTTQGTITDFDGNFALGNVPDDATLIFSFVGMQTQELTVAGQSNFTIVMEEDAIGLEEVVAIGYGSMKKSSLTGSITAVDGEKLQKSTSPNISNALAGRLPGLVVISRTGEPGNDSSTLRIRGANTLGDNSPLIVVDGIANRSLERLDPATIESVTVLKDASAAIYGAQSANGVILITTKRGSIGKPSIQLSLNQGWNTPTVLPKMSDAATYAQLINEIKHYAGQPARYTEEDIQLYKDGSDPWGHPNTDWFKETVKTYSPQRYGNLSLTGGADKVKYFVSLGSNFQDGMFKNGETNYSQVDFRSNLDAQISSNIKLSFDIAGRQENRNYSGVGNNGGAGALNIFWAMNRAYPYLPAKWPNGLPGPDVEYGANPTVIVTDATGYDKTKTYVLESNMKLVVNIPWIQGLSFTGNVSIDKTFLNRKRWQTPWSLYTWDGSYDENNEPVVTEAKKGFSDARLQQWMEDRTKTTINGLINYQRVFANVHDVKILLGSERITGDRMDFWAFRRYYTSEALDQMFAGSDILKDNGGAGEETARHNYFGRLNYMFDSKYLAEFVWRYDGSYIFPESKRFGFFPGISLGWRISEENFWKDNLGIINDFKIRASWGKTGNDRIEPYQYLTTYGFNNTYVFDQNVSVKTLEARRIPNNNVTWEIANQSNIGFDGQLLDGKFTLSAEYFYNLRTNILWWRNASVPATAGLNLPRENIGEVVNKGFELELGYNMIRNDFKLQFSANTALSKNKIKFWDETPGIPEYQKSTGKPMNTRLYYNAIGVFVDQAAVDAYPHWEGARPGDIIFEDVNKDGVINGLDKVRSNKTSLPTLTGGFSIDMEYKNLYASILFQGAAGAERSYRTFSGEAGNFLYNDIKDRWTEEKPSSTHPRTWNRSLEYWMTDGEPNNTYWVRKSDYLRLKNIEFGYVFKSAMTKKLGLENLRVYVSGQNLITFTEMTDFDPESPDHAPGSIWVNSEVYPLNKNINIGLSVTF